jgi:dihydrofolate reductase
MDWLHFSRDVTEVMASYWKTVDTVVMGRKTYEVAAAQGGSGSWAPGVRATYVFSRTLASVVGKGTQLVRSDAGEFVRQLKEQPGGDICVLGGGELARALLAGDALDELGLNVHPVLLGGGVPFLPELGRRVRLELVENRALDGGCALLRYRVARKVS